MDSHVIHVDLYPSNILWKVDEFGEIQIRIVDWDVATFMGERFPEAISEVFQVESSRQYYWVNNGVAEPKCDAWFLFVLSKMTSQERENVNGEVHHVNSAYKKVVDRLTQDKGSEGLKNEFEAWFETEWNKDPTPST